MADQEHLQILKQGWHAWNLWRLQNPHLIPDLCGADLQNANLNSMNLSRVNLSGTNLCRVDFQWADFSQADLNRAVLVRANGREANFSSAKLAGANLSWAKLQDADLRRSDLHESDLRGARLDRAILSEASLIAANLHAADLAEADFSRCTLGGTILSNIDLSRAKGLDSVEHYSASSIGVDAFYLSKGKIPEVFLRGAGVPEKFIDFMRSLVGTTLEFYSCFISYSIKDREFAERLHADLQTAGVRCWYFPEDAQWGQPVWGEIDRSIKAHDKLVVICSTDALQSGPVNREIERALQREDRDHHHILFPIRLDDYIFENWQHPRKADVQSKVIGDFRDWKTHDSYRKSFARLLRDLKVEDKAESAVQGS